MGNKPRPKVKKKSSRPHWRSIPDALLHGYPSWPSPESLHPDDWSVIKAAAGIPAAKVIAESYRCRLPVVIVESISDAGEVICPI